MFPCQGGSFFKILEMVFRATAAKI